MRPYCFFCCPGIRKRIARGYTIRPNPHPYPTFARLLPCHLFPRNRADSNGNVSDVAYPSTPIPSPRLSHLPLKPLQNPPKHAPHPPTAHLPQRSTRLTHLLHILHTVAASPQFRKGPTHHPPSKQTHGDLIRAVGCHAAGDTVVAQREHVVYMSHGLFGNVAVSPEFQVLLCERAVIFIGAAASD